MSNINSLNNFPKVNTVQSSDLVHISQGGEDKAVQVSALIGGLDSGVVLNFTPKDETSTSRLLLGADNHSYITCLNSSTTTLTLSSEEDAGWGLGDQIFIRKGATGNVIVAPSSGVTINTNSTLVTSGQVGFLLYKGSDVWDFVDLVGVGGSDLYELEVELLEVIDELDTQLSAEIDNNKLEIDSKQNWFDVINKTKTTPDPRILVQRATGSFDRLFIFINHRSNFYQRWELTRGGGTGDGFDNGIPTHPNGNMWFVNKVDHVLVGPLEEVAATSVDMTKVGTIATFGDDIRIAAGYAECTVFGTVVYLNYVARDDAGIANVYVDGGLVGTLDQYSTSSGGVLTASKIAEGLTNANHVIRIEHTGTQNPSSSNDYIRVRRIIGVGLQDYDNVASFGVYTAAMSNGSTTFKIGNAASELAIQSTLAGSTVWSGAYHKYCYPKVADNQVIHIDGLLVDFSDMVAGDFVLCNSVRLVQALELSNVDDPIADLTMQHYFTSEGCNVKFTLEWTAVVDVGRSYQAMWPTQAESAVLGGMQGRYVADYDNANINVFKKSFNAIAYNDTNDWISGFKSNNEYGANWPNAGYTGLYIWDRPTDFKIYLRKFSGETTIGDIWLSDVTFTIGHCPNPNDVLMLPIIPS